MKIDERDVAANNGFHQSGTRFDFASDVVVRLNITLSAEFSQF